MSEYVKDYIYAMEGNYRSPSTHFNTWSVYTNSADTVSFNLRINGFFCWVLIHID